MCYTLDEIRHAVISAVDDYHSSGGSPSIKQVSLFGSYADGSARDDSDVDLLVTFSDSIVSLFTLARALEAMERRFDVPIDLVQKPLPEDALLTISKEVPLCKAA